MTEEERHYHVYRILSNYTKVDFAGQTFIVKNPTYEILYEAERKYWEAIENGRYSGLLRKNQLKPYLISNGLISFQYEKEYKELEKNIDNLKVRLFKTFINQPTQHKKIGKELGLAKSRQNEVYASRHCLDYITLDGLAETVKQYYIFSCLIYTEGGAPLISKDGYYINKVMNKYLEQKLNPIQCREIVRNEPWKSIWNVGEHKGGSDEYTMLVLFSKMYDNAREHTECPSDTIIDDDDMFDGWMIFQRRQREKSQMDKQFDTGSSTKGRKMTSKGVSANDGEFFVPVVNKEEAEQIYEMNTLNSKMAVRQRQKLINEKGEILDVQMPDVQRELQNRATDMFKNRRK